MSDNNLTDALVTKINNSITGFTESDPTVPEYVKNISQENISDWNSKVEDANYVHTDNNYTNTEKSKLGDINISYGTCSTAAGTAEKVVETADTNWRLVSGSIIAVKFTATNTAASPTLNVNGTGAKSIWYNTGLITSNNKDYAGTANRIILFMYDGTQYVFLGWSIDNNTTYTNAALGHGYGTCSTAEATATKVVSLSNYSLTTGGAVSVKFTYAVPANAKLNINSKGEKPIYYQGAAIVAGIIKAGDTATFIYNGSQYHLISIDKVFALTDDMITKINGIESGAQVNKIETVKVNGTALSISNKAVNITVPTDNSSLANGAGYQTAAQVNAAIQNVIGAAPAALDTLQELATALGNNPNFATTITTELANKIDADDLVALTNDEVDTIFTF